VRGKRVLGLPCIKVSVPRFRGPDTTHLGHHPALRGMKTLQVTLGAANHSKIRGVEEVVVSECVGAMPRSRTPEAVRTWSGEEELPYFHFVPFFMDELASPKR
jgi:hypothetical protein